MHPAERLRQILPFVVAFYLAGSVAQLHATQPRLHLPRDGLSVADIASGIKWHMLEMARNEQSEMFAGSPGN